MNDINNAINKSLDELDALAENFAKSVDDENLSKAIGEGDVPANEVSEDAPEPTPEEGEEGEGEEGMPEEGEEPAPSENDEDVDSDTEGSEEGENEEDVEKSLEGDLKSNQSIRKALEVSEFLDELVKGISSKIDSHSKSIDTHNESLAKSLEASNQHNEMLAKSLMGIVKSHKVLLEQNTELQKSVRTLTKKMAELEHQPMVRKSVASAAQPLNKSFEASAGHTVTAKNSLSKSQISYMLLKGVEEGKDLKNDLLAFEGTGKTESLSDGAKMYLGIN